MWRMPDPTARQRQATVGEINNALCAARCAAQLAGMETQEFVVRELLLTTLEQIDRAAEAIRRLPSR
jgi:nitrogen-specific signal transduction histidine kinase